MDDLENRAVIFLEGPHGHPAKVTIEVQMQREDGQEPLTLEDAAWLADEVKRAINGLRPEPTESAQAAAQGS